MRCAGCVSAKQRHQQGDERDGRFNRRLKLLDVPENCGAVRADLRADRLTPIAGGMILHGSCVRDVSPSTSYCLTMASPSVWDGPSEMEEPKESARTFRGCAATAPCAPFDSERSNGISLSVTPTRDSNELAAHAYALVCLGRWNPARPSRGRAATACCSDAPRFADDATTVAIPGAGDTSSNKCPDCRSVAERIAADDAGSGGQAWPGTG